MTTPLDRRSFVRNVAGVAAAGALAPSIIGRELDRQPRAGTPVESASSLLAAFGAAPGLLTRLDPLTGTTIDSAPWVLQTLPGDDLRALLRPISDADLAAVDAWLANSDGDPSYSSDDATVTGALLRTNFLGSLNLGDIVAPLLAGIAENREIKLDMQYMLPEATSNESPIFFDPATALPIVQSTHEGRFTPTPNWRVPIQVTPTLRYQLAYFPDDIHPFGTCVRQDVRHIHWHVQRKTASGGWPNVANYHIGVAKEGKQRCLVIWESERKPQMCFKRCSWTRQDLQKAVEMIIIAAAVAAGVVLAGWVIASVGASVTAVLLPALAIL